MSLESFPLYQIKRKVTDLIDWLDARLLDCPAKRLALRQLTDALEPVLEAERFRLAQPLPPEPPPRSVA